MGAGGGMDGDMDDIKAPSADATPVRLLCSLLVVGWREVLCGRARAYGWGRALHQLASMRADSGVMTTWGDGMGEEQL
jgi:hypothetical protein